MNIQNSMTRNLQPVTEKEKIANVYLEKREKLRLISFTEKGSRLNKKCCLELEKQGYLCEGYAVERFARCHDLKPLKDSLSNWCETAFREADGIVFISACGIAVRAIAPYVKDKYSDPAVVTMDEGGAFCVSLLSGHIGGANTLTLAIAKVTGASPVISTATDCNGCFAVDVFAQKNQLLIHDRESAKRVSADLLEGRQVLLLSEMELGGALPEGLTVEKSECDSCVPIEITYRRDRLDRESSRDSLLLIPSILVLGIGCKKSVCYQKLKEFILQELEKAGFYMEAAAVIASIDRKKEEKAILQLAADYKLPFITYSAEELKRVPGTFTDSSFVEAATGIGNVCERAAVLGSEGGTLLLHKTARDGMTLAVARKERILTFE